MSIAELQTRAVIELGGADWRGFLQALITQDVETLGPGEARFGALLTPQGRLLHDMIVVGTAEGCLLDVEAAGRSALVQRLTMYRLRAKVQIASPDVGVWAFFSTARSRAGGNPSGVSGGPEADWVPASAGTSGMWVQDPRLPELGRRGYGAFQADASEADYEAHRLALGVPGPADWGSDKTYPIEADFDLLNGIDFKKGCFVGQETTSRMKRRGQVKNRMLPIVFEGSPPPPGTEMLAGDLRAGEVLSGTEGRAIALLRLDRALDRELTVDGRPARAEPPAWLGALAADSA